MTRAPLLRSAAALAAAACLVTLAPRASAQVGKEGIAEGLFQEGKKLFDQGSVSAACQKFKASLDTDKTLGTLIALAACHEKEGKTASAWAGFTEAAALAKKEGKPEQEAFARGRIPALEKQLARMTLTAAKVDGLEIKIDGVAVPLEGLGSALPVDPGERNVEASAPGRKSWSQKVNVAAATSSTTVAIPELEVDPNAPKGDRVVIINNEQKGTDSTKLIVGAAVAGVGAIGVGVGLYLWQGVAVPKESDANENFRTGRITKAEYDRERDTAISNQTVGILSTALGAVALGTGVFLIITSFKGGGSEQPKPAQATYRLVPSTSPHGGGMTLVGTF